MNLYYCFIVLSLDTKKDTAKKILKIFGWEIQDMDSRAFEPLCIIWCIPRFR